MEHSIATMMIITFMLVGFVRSDLAKDREECTDQLLALATCLPYVGGDAKAPTKDCCGGFGQVIAKSEKCVCVLIKDKDDPQLGLKINATLAVQLPTACHITAPNITDSILHIPPNSTLAKEFESLGKLEGNTNSTSTSKNLKDGPGGKAESVKSNGGNKKKSCRQISSSQSNALNLNRPSLAADDDIHDLLPHYGFPKGLLPNNIKSYTLSDVGDFTVDLNSPCYVKFPDQIVFYDDKIAGKLSYGSVKDVKGIQAKEAFFWVPITAMESNPSSGTIVFSVGFVSKTLPASMFDSVPSCSRKQSFQENRAFYV
ncbi:unnamed protein product [Arabis nemorensis]|uniref:Bifunctional inhibitor/plant lipid transfer protein/seed storage helical domain-containing protein n=1 Tax=Arabis nemorensis TaxID=586526 RepID=A0A565BFS5_9BRAS|nr:unnamed protein product [Arabis nemorensis]